MDVSEQSLEEVVRAEAPDGADVVVDTTGNSRIFETCLALVPREGRICLQGYYPDPIAIDFLPTHLTRPIVTFPCGRDAERDAELAEDLAASRRTVIAPLITHRVPYQEAPSAYRLVVDHPKRSLGMVFGWEEAAISKIRAQPRAKFRRALTALRGPARGDEGLEGWSERFLCCQFEPCSAGW